MNDGLDQPSIVVVGPGAIGCTAAAAMIDGGQRVTMAARTPFDRLEVGHPSGSVVADVTCLTDPTRAEVSDIVVLAVKAHQTAVAADWLQALVGPGTKVLILQNGVEHLERVRPLVDHRAELVPAVVQLPARRRRPGVVEVESAGFLAVPAGGTADELARLIDSDFLSIRPVDDWTTAAWTKLMINAATAIGVLARKTNRVLSADDEARALTEGLMREVAAVGRAEGARLADDLPETIIARVQSGPGADHTSSILADRLVGNETEWEARNQVVGRLAARHGIEVPINRMITTLLRLGEPKPVDRASSTRGSIDIAEFLLFCDRTLDGLDAAVGRLDDEQVNRRPELPGANSPFQLVVHASAAARWWTAHIICGEPVDRDRDSEFEARGTVADARAAVARTRQELHRLGPFLESATGLAHQGETRTPLGRDWTVGAALLHTYEELAQHLGHLELTVDLIRSD